MIAGADLSHYQGVSSWAQVKSAIAFVVLKATEGTGYVDPTFAARRAQAHAAGLIVGHYHFARAGNAVAEAQFFLRVIGNLQPGEFLVLDWEVPGTNPPGWCKTWLDTVYQATGVRPLIYMNQSAVNGSNWSAVAADYGLWLARYDGAPGVFNSVPYWGQPAMKQWSDKGNVPGIGSCDVNSFNGTAQQLLAYGKGGTAPAPIVPEDDDMKLIRNKDTGGVYEYTPYELHPVADNDEWAALHAAGYPDINSIPELTTAQFRYLQNRVDVRRAALLTDVHRNVLCRTPDDRPGRPWPVDSIYGSDDNVGEVKAAVEQLSTGGVDPKTVVTGVLSGLNGAKLNVQAGA